jgi:hypothetical protein
MHGARVTRVMVFTGRPSWLTFRRMSNDAETTAPQQPRVIGRPFPRGVSGNPMGRPVGSKNKLQEQFLLDLSDAWREYGVEALRKCATQEPSVFVKTIAGLLPRDVSLSVGIDAVAFATSFQQAMEVLGIEQPVKRRRLPGRKQIEVIEHVKR